MELNDYIKSNPDRAIPFKDHHILDELVVETEPKIEAEGGLVDVYFNDFKFCSWYIGKGTKTVTWR